MITWNKGNSLKEKIEKEVRVTYLVKCENQAHPVTREYNTLEQAKKFIEDDRQMFSDPRRRKMWSSNLNLNDEELNAFWDHLLNNDVKLYKVTHVTDYKELPVEEQGELF